jgi:hypothetical protein
MYLIDYPPADYNTHCPSVPPQQQQQQQQPRLELEQQQRQKHTGTAAPKAPFPKTPSSSGKVALPRTELPFTLPPVFLACSISHSAVSNRQRPITAARHLCEPAVRLAAGQTQALPANATT